MFSDYHNPNDYWQHNPMMQDPNIDPDDAMKSGCLVCVFYLTALIVGLLLCLLFGSCTTTEYVPVIEHKMDTLIQTKVQHDSIYINDSAVITEKGDTVKIEKWHTKYVEKQVHDTIYQSKTDSVPAPYPVEVIKEVEKPLNWFQQTLMILGCISLGSILVYIVSKVKKYLPLR